jgi:hypothetical protein
VMKIRLPVIPSITWAFGPPMGMKVANLSFRAERGICFFSQKSRFLVAPLFGMTARLDDSRGSEVRNLFLLKPQKQIPRRSAPRNDRAGQFRGSDEA